MRQAEKIEKRPVRDLVPYANNARLHSKVQVEQIAASIKEFGFINPVLVDDDGGIVAGHGRVLAARKLKLKDVPCINVGYLTEAQRRAFIIADNKISSNSSWDQDLLRVELEAITSDMLVGLTGFTDAELESLNVGSDFMDATDGQGQTRGEAEPKLKWGKSEVPLTAQEIADLDAALKAHVEKNGVSYGFIRELLASVAIKPRRGSRGPNARAQA